jgi:hypothetical protein
MLTDVDNYFFSFVALLSTQFFWASESGSNREKKRPQKATTNSSLLENPFRRIISTDTEWILMLGLDGAEDRFFLRMDKSQINK